MFREFKRVRQESIEGTRRWFESDAFDLIVWLDPAGALTGFQLCYDFGRGEHALTWRNDVGFTHHAIDAGDHTPFKNEAPILIPDGAIPWERLRQVYEERCPSLDPALREELRRRLLAAGLSSPVLPR